MSMMQSVVVMVAAMCALGATAFAKAPSIRIDLAGEGKAMSPLLHGIFYEDISYASDGGLYAELVENRSFEYAPTANRDWANFTGWDFVERGGRGDWAIANSIPLHANNPHYLTLEKGRGEGQIGTSNDGFDGISIKAGEQYRFSTFAYLLYVGGRWGGDGTLREYPLAVRLETPGGDVLAEETLMLSERAWKRFEVTLSPSTSASDARLVLLTNDEGGIALDEVSLFPTDTFKGRENGLRKDLAEAIAALNPRFVRFPGGCVAHGDGIPNMYRWKDTVGPTHERKQQHNIWRYWQTNGLGYFEFFQFCEDLGAAPLPVVPAGVSCQNSGHMGGTGQQCIAMEDMDDYVQEVLDLIEYANGPADSGWGKVRADAGHPEPFGLKYLGVGNEDKITPEFEARFKMIHDAVKAKHPEIVVIGTTGPGTDGEDFDKGWALARDMDLEMVDEHGYKSPQWLWDNTDRFDSFDRDEAKIYLGEWAAHDEGRRSTWWAALAEAAYLTGLERNADHVIMQSYAPLLAKRGNTRWAPDLIYFDNESVYPTLSYEVQRLFSEHTGDTYLPLEGFEPEAGWKLAASAVRDGDGVTLKIVNGDDASRSLTFDFAGLDEAIDADVSIWAGDLDAENRDGEPAAIQPVTSKESIGEKWTFEAPPHSLTIVTMLR